MVTATENAIGLTIFEVAELCRVKPTTARRWASVGIVGPDGARVKLKGLRLPGSWRFERDDLATFLAVFQPVEEV
ncbi:MAG: helix-turn-helix domain-containing protein [Candidatus Nanopelagicales bacterium]